MIRLTDRPGARSADRSALEQSIRRVGEADIEGTTGFEGIEDQAAARGRRIWRRDIDASICTGSTDLRWDAGLSARATRRAGEVAGEPTSAERHDLANQRLWHTDFTPSARARLTIGDRGIASSFTASFCETERVAAKAAFAVPSGHTITGASTSLPDSEGPFVSAGKGTSDKSRSAPLSGLAPGARSRLERLTVWNTEPRIEVRCGGGAGPCRAAVAGEVTQRPTELALDRVGRNRRGADQSRRARLVTARVPFEYASRLDTLALDHALLAIPLVMRGAPLIGRATLGTKRITQLEADPHVRCNQATFLSRRTSPGLAGGRAGYADRLAVAAPQRVERGEIAAETSPTPFRVTGLSISSFGDSLRIAEACE